MSLFTETPIEAALWSFSVSLQEKIAVGLFQTPLFKGAVALFMGIVIMRALVRTGTGSDASKALLSAGGTLLCCLTGLAFLGATSGTSFAPETSSGAKWASLTHVQTGNRFSSLKTETKGLKFYVLIHESANSLSKMVSQVVGNVFGDANSSQAPNLLFSTLRETAKSTLDDPEILATTNTLFESCSRQSGAVTGVAFASLSHQFDLQKENCAALYDKLRTQLDGWARERISSPGSKLTVLAEAARNNALTRAIGLDDSQALKNKVIASAVSDYLQTRAGLSNNNVSTDALLQPGQNDAMDGGASYWVSLSRKFSIAGALNATVRPLTGTDYEAADARNDLAALYTKVTVFLPAVRGFAKGLLALMFLVAAARMAFGSTSLMVSWLWCLALVTAYEPLSTFLYQATITLTQTPETVDAMAALKNDPLVLVGAQVMDSYASKVQATYFVLQLGLIALTATAGLGVFRYSNKMSGALVGGLASKALTAVRHTAMLTKVPATLAAGKTAGAGSSSAVQPRKESRS